MEKIIIIGAGPAGYTATIYAARANLEPLMFTGSQPGGQLMTTTEVENFPGFSEGILGPDLMDKMEKQAKKHGTRIEAKTVTEVDLSSHPFKIKVGAEEYETEALIIATGALARRLGIPSEDKYWGKGVSACATCDGPLFRNKEIVVIGGGDAAMEEANFLARFATKVTIINRSEEYKASEIMLDRAKKNPKISFISNAVVEEILGDEKLVTGIKLKNVKTGEFTDVKTQGVFVAIGHKPASEFLKGKLEMDEVGYIIKKEGTSLTSVEGVFACGDVADRRYRQAISAAGTGCMAAIDAERWLEEK